MLTFEGNLLATTGDIRVEGEQHLREIPQGKNVIILTTHISDIDVPAAVSVVGRHFDIAITNMSYQHSFLKDPAISTALHIAGKKHFIPIDYARVAGENRGAFNPDNYPAMREALRAGKAVVIPGHNPSKQWQLSKGGYGAAYLADITENSIIVPVSVNVKKVVSSGENRKENTVVNMRNRPDVDIYIGKPFEMDRVERMDDMARIMQKRSAGEYLTDEDVERFHALSKILRQQSDMMMRKLAEPLPEDKKGLYAGA